MVDWTEKYRPDTLSEIRGNNKSRDELESWASSWDEHGEAVIVHGSPGVGKTSAAHALANDMGWSIVELNASDTRTKDAIEQYAGRAASNTTLVGSRQLIILDEADNLHRHNDRGGAAAMRELVQEASQPIILIANEFYEMSSSLRRACQEIQFNDVSVRSIVPVLRDICRKESITFDESVLQTIAEKNRGDLRGAIKDLQARSIDGVIVEVGSEGERDRTEDIFGFLDAVLKEQSAQEALQTAYAVDETPDSLLLWIEDKVPLVYHSTELANAYTYLSNADTWLGRVRATQQYKYWRYATDNLSAGVAAVRLEDRGGWTQYGGAPYRSSRDSIRDHIAKHIATSASVSVGTARRDILPYLEEMTYHCKNRELTVNMAAKYNLDADHISYITGSGKSTKKVGSIVEDASALRAQQAVEHSGNAFMKPPSENSSSQSSEVDSDSRNSNELENHTDSTDNESSTDEHSDDEQQAGLEDFV